MVEAVLKSSMGRMRRRSRMCMKQERERLDMWLEKERCGSKATPRLLSLIHISEPTRLLSISYAVFCLKKKKKNIFFFFFFNDTATTEIYTRSLVGSVRCV